MEIPLSYTELKNLILSKNLTWQYVEDDNKYMIYTADHTIIITAYVWLSGHEPSDSDVDQNTADRVDFETNYKSTSNQLAIGVNNSPFAVPALALDGQSFSATIPHGTTANIDFKFTSSWWTNGAMWLSDGVIGDTVSYQIIDIDNMLGYGADFVVSQYVTNWFIFPNSPTEFETPFTATVPVGLYIRCIYTSIGSSDVHFYANLYTYKQNT